MGNRSEMTASQKNAKRKWEKPILRRMDAGSAEVNTGTVDDGDPGSALNNS